LTRLADFCVTNFLRLRGCSDPALIGNNQDMNWLDNVKFDAQGLIPVIAQEVGTNDVLMFAWMNREALAQTADLGRAVYFSRSRGRLWHKGEESGNVQTVHEIRMDCDNDVLLLKVSQPIHVHAMPRGGPPAQSIACHTGRHSCFFSILDNGAWRIDAPVLKDPQTIYK
jgi:phosphoribosyl-AMP cyclohydrolase